MHKLGINFYDSEESREGLVYLKKSFELMDSLPDNLKLRHLNTIQDLYNHIAIIMSDTGGHNEDQDKEKNLEALEYLNKAGHIYEIVKVNTEDLPQKSVMTSFDKYLLKSAKAKKSDVNFSFYIN